MAYAKYGDTVFELSPVPEPSALAPGLLALAGLPLLGQDRKDAAFLFLASVRLCQHHSQRFEENLQVQAK